MCHRTKFVNESFLRGVDLPYHGKTYTVIPHGEIIDSTRNQLQTSGFSIDREIYRSTNNGDVAQGVYHLVSDKDPDMGMMFAWSNSYNKQMRFKCAVGGQVFVCMNGVVSGDMANYRRKHTGTALQEAQSSIQFQILHADEYFQKLVEQKEQLKNIKLTRKQKGHVIGDLLIDKEIVSSTQVSLVMKEISKPSFTYNSDPDSAWTLYNHVTHALKLSHPLTYLSDHQKLHDHFVSEFLMTNSLPVSTPAAFADQVIEQSVETTEPELETAGVFGVNFL